MYRQHKDIFDSAFKTLKRFINDPDFAYKFELSSFGSIVPRDTKAMQMYYKHQELLKEGKITQEAFDKYQNSVINVLKYANISLDSGSDSQQ